MTMPRSSRLSFTPGVSHLFDDSNNSDQAFEREKFTLNRRQQFVGSRQCIRHQNA